MEPIPVVSPMRTVKGAGFIPAGDGSRRQRPWFSFWLHCSFIEPVSCIWKERHCPVRRSSGTACRQGTPRQNRTGSGISGKSYRRNTYIKAILCMGIDRPGSLEETMTAGFGGQADGIFLVAQDTARDRIRVLVIPRDTMTEITLTDLSGNELGSSIQHLTLAYAYGDGREKSCRYMTEAVSRLLGAVHRRIHGSEHVRPAFGQ